jgi:hypothetical protein
MRSTSPWIAVIAAGAAHWLLGCTADDNGGTACDDASFGDAMADGGSEANSAFHDASSGDSPVKDSSASDSSVSNSSPGDSSVGDSPSRESSLADAPIADRVAGDAPAAASDAAMSTASAAADAGSTTTTGSTILAAIRVANWSPDAPALDFCVAPHGTGQFQGPMVAAQALALPNAGSACPASTVGLAFPQVSSYALVQAGQYDVRLVVAGVTSCAAGVADATSLPAIVAGGFETVALLGELNRATATAPGLQLAGFSDDPAPVGAIALRFIDAAPAFSVLDFGTGSGSSFKAVFSNVAFGQTAKTAVGADGGAASVDSNGYLSRSAMTSVSLAAEVHGALAPDGSVQDTAVAKNVSAAAGSVLTMVAVGAVAGAGGAASLLQCIDNAGTVCPLSNCTVISQ